MDHNVTKDSPVDLTNATLGSSLTPPTTNWGWVSIASIIMLITAFGLNLMALLRFLTDMTLISPFNLLIVNLVLANVVYFIILGPLDFINGLYTGWWLGEAWCTIYMYGLWVLSLVQMSSHPLIAIDRLWAVSFPINYRKVHNKRFILLLCSGAWLLAHLVALPVVITDARYYRLPVATNGCSINLGIPFQNAWVIMVQCVCLLLVFIVLFAFPVIAYKLKSRKKIGAGATANQSSNNTGGSSTHNVTTGNQKRSCFASLNIHACHDGTSKMDDFSGLAVSVKNFT